VLCLLASPSTSSRPDLVASGLQPLQAGAFGAPPTLQGREDGEVCLQLTTPQCSTSLMPLCYDFTDTGCHSVPKEVCIPVEESACTDTPFQASTTEVHCQTVTSDHCHQAQPEQMCVNVGGVDCQEETVEVCKTRVTENHRRECIQFMEPHCDLNYDKICFLSFSIDSTWKQCKDLTSQACNLHKRSQCINVPSLAFESYCENKTITTCREQPSQECMTTSRTSCKPRTSEVCLPGLGLGRNLTSRVCRKKSRQACIMVDSTVCHTSPRTRCKEVPQTSCHPVTTTECFKPRPAGRPLFPPKLPVPYHQSPHVALPLVHSTPPHILVD